MADQKKDERTATERIADILRAETEARTLSLEAVEAISFLRSEHIDALDLIGEKEEALERERVKFDKLDKGHAELREKYTAIVEANAAHEERAVELAGARQSVEVQTARLEAGLAALDRQDETLRILFRAPTVRRNISRSETAVEPDQSPNYSGATVSTSKSTSETEEVTEE